MPKSLEDILNETLAPEIKASLQEAFDAKLAVARVELEETVRTELANRYEHDKGQLVEAMNAMLTDVIREHEEAKAKEISKLAETRGKYRAAITETKSLARERISAISEATTKLVTESLISEVKSLRAEKLSIAREAANLSEGVASVKSKLVENHEKHLAKINEFITRQVARELNEFQEDKRALAETRVSLLANNKSKLLETQKKFIAEAASKVDAAITETLSREMRQLHEDVERYRQNEFGRELFEAFAATYMTSHLSEGSQVRKLQKVLESKEQEIASAKSESEAHKSKLVEAKKEIDATARRAVVLEERMQRNKIMGELLSNLRGDKRSVMESMLETTKTASLKTAFDKLLPVVLSEGARKSAAPTGKTVLSETKNSSPAITGDRKVRVDEAASDVDQTIAEIVQLAGIRKVR